MRRAPYASFRTRHPRSDARMTEIFAQRSDVAHLGEAHCHQDEQVGGDAQQSAGHRDSPAPPPEVPQAARVAPPEHERRHAGAIEPHEDDDVGQRVRPGHAHLVDDGVGANQHGRGDGPSQSRETGCGASRRQSKPGDAAADQEDAQNGEEATVAPPESAGPRRRRRAAPARARPGTPRRGHRGCRLGPRRSCSRCGSRRCRPGAARRRRGQAGDEERRGEEDGGRDHRQPAGKELVVLALDDQIPAGVEAGGQQNEAERKEPHDRRFVIPRACDFSGSRTATRTALRDPRISRVIQRRRSAYHAAVRGTRQFGPVGDHATSGSAGPSCRRSLQISRRSAVA